MFEFALKNFKKFNQSQTIIMCNNETNGYTMICHTAQIEYVYFFPFLWQKLNSSSEIISFEIKMNFKRKSKNTKKLTMYECAWILKGT